MFQRIDQAGYKQLIDERVLADAETMMVFGPSIISFQNRKRHPRKLTQSGSG